MALPPYHANLADLPHEHRFENAAGESTYHRTGMITEAGMVCWVRMTSGFTMSDMAPDKHHHPNDMLIYVIEGRCEMVLYGTDRYILEKDSTLYVPPHAPHYLELIDDEPCYIMEVFAPQLNHYLYVAEHQTSAIAPQRLPDGSREKGWEWQQMAGKSTPQDA